MSVKDVAMPHEEPDSGSKILAARTVLASSGIDAATARVASARYRLVFAARKRATSGDLKGTRPVELRPGRDAAPGSWRPGKGRAASATARAGCGRGRDGRGAGRGRGTPGSRAGDGRKAPITEIRGSSRRRAELHGSPRGPDALRELTLPWQGQLTQSEFGPLWGTRFMQRLCDGHISGLPAGSVTACAVPSGTSRDPGVPWRPQPARAATGRPGPSAVPAARARALPAPGRPGPDPAIAPTHLPLFLMALWRP